MSESTPDRKAAVAWCIYDWASSAFPTVIMTFVFAAYFAQGVAEDPETGTGQWGLTLSLSGLAIAISAPLLGAIADRGRGGRAWLAGFVLLCCAASAGLWWVRPEPGSIILALVLVGLANIGFELAQVFYNAMLPSLARPGRMGRLSGWAWGVGYAGGLSCLAVALLLFVQPDPPYFGLDRAAAEQVRITGPFVAFWFLAFALPLLLTRNISLPPAALPGGIVGPALASLYRTLKSLPRRGQIGRFLLARMLYTDGLNTLFAFGGIYAAGTFGMSFEEILVFGIILNVTAGLGATAFAWADDIFGAKSVILVSVCGLAIFGGLILLVESKLWFYLLGSAIGIFVGPAQAASRSLMAHMAPADLRNELFGLYALTGRATAFVGPALVGWVTVAFDSQRIGMATILPFFVVGFILMLPLKVESRA